jgi:hypothetical protein
MPYALCSVVPRLAAMSRRRNPRVTGDAQQDPGVVGQEGPVAIINIYQILEMSC